MINQPGLEGNILNLIKGIYTENPTAQDFPDGPVVKNLSWQPTLVFLPGLSHEQRNLANCSPWDGKELDMTERLSTYIQTYVYMCVCVHIYIFFVRFFPLTGYYKILSSLCCKVGPCWLSILHLKKKRIFLPNAGDTGLIPGPGSSHLFWGN